MKKMFVKLLFFAGVVVSLTGCFKPDEVSADDPTSKLVGFWEVDHIREVDYVRNVLDDGTVDEYNYHDDYYISCDDGHQEWVILGFSDSFITMVATDDPEMVEVLYIAIPYTFDGETLVSSLVQGDHGGNSVEVTFDGDDRMTLYMLDEGNIIDENTGLIAGYEKYQSWTTYKRVEE